MSDIATVAARFADHLVDRVVADARGTEVEALEVQPSGRFWLGTLASEEHVRDSGLGDRGERMAPCAIGFRVRPAGPPPWHAVVVVRACAWQYCGTDDWRKTAVQTGRTQIQVEPAPGAAIQVPLADLATGFREVLKCAGLEATVRIETDTGRDGRPELTIQVVNTSPASSSELRDTNLYETELELRGLETEPFLLEGLPDSFRYDRAVPAYGMNCGVRAGADGTLHSTDTVEQQRYRPAYWVSEQDCPDLRFATLAEDPLPSLRKLVDCHSRWNERAWAGHSIRARVPTDDWSQETWREVEAEAKKARHEAERLQSGLELLEQHPDLLRAYRLANAAMQHASDGRYSGWRPFQVGFQLATLPAVLGDQDDVDEVDVLWFATGGGKTETYLGVLVTAAIFDRIRGKTHGITAWSRFPLRLLSLQQTQRFADALAGAELVRREHELGGDPFRLGFFVGASNTPNEVKEEPGPGDPDPYDETMPGRNQVLLECPFCRGSVSTEFDHAYWILQHRCGNDACPWPEEALPFHVVDHEIYRLLPTVVVGTLDKAALIGFQAAMLGFVGPPVGYCSESGHGHTYATRSKRPNGCLVPGCKGSALALPQEPAHYRIGFRLQDELHLLRDSLGAVDAHYERLLDALSETRTGGRSKILASSATLSGYLHQCDALYGRVARVFPALGPSADTSFWTTTTTQRLRRFVALAPRGQTLEFAADRMLTELQRVVRQALADPVEVAGRIGIAEADIEQMIRFYGTNVVYGNTIRDLQAAKRSMETEVSVEGNLEAVELTGHTPFDEVRESLKRLEEPESDFQERIHLVAASSMMSHGVDIDRLNSMVVLGQPLTTAEFIQATARIGRAWPGVVFVLHKMARERDAGLFRSFATYVSQGDRFVEPVPITRRSRRVLERTISGLGHARFLMAKEPEGGRRLTTAKAFVEAIRDGFLSAEEEIEALISALSLGEDEPGLRQVVHDHVKSFFSSIQAPVKGRKFVSEYWARGPMTSLRDVEESAPVFDSE